MHEKKNTNNLAPTLILAFFIIMSFFSLISRSFVIIFAIPTIVILLSVYMLKNPQITKNKFTISSNDKINCSFCSEELFITDKFCQYCGLRIY